MRRCEFVLLITPLVVACAFKSDEDVEDEPQVVGSIAPDGEDVSAEVAIMRAFAMHTENRFAAYFSNNASATCEAVTEYLRADAPHDPSGFLVGGACDVAVRIDTWEDGTGRSASNDPLAAAGFVINCYFGDLSLIHI